MKKTVLTAFSVLCLLSTMCLVGLTTNIQTVKASAAIYIRADGSVEGTTAISSVDNVIYTFTDNIYDSITIERNNTVVDGAGYTLRGSGSGNGVTLFSIENVTMQNMNIRDFENGFYLQNSSNNIISGNGMRNTPRCIYLWYSSHNMISQNHMNASGLYLNQSFSNTISLNTMTNSSNIRLTNSKLNNITSNTITDSLTYAIRPFNDCSGTLISKNNITTCKSGVRMFTETPYYYSGVTISENIISNCVDYGIWMHRSNGNNISGNQITDNGQGIWMSGSWDNTFTGNNLTNNQYNLLMKDVGLRNNIDTTNTVDGKPVYYLYNQSNLVINPSTFPQVGYLALIK